MENRTLVYAKNINKDYNVTGLIDISKNPPKIYCFCTEEIAKEILYFHAQQSKEREWISVTDRLPTERPLRFESVIVNKSNGVVMECLYNTKTEQFMGWNKEPLNHKVTHWMPLPTSPL